MQCIETKYLLPTNKRGPRIAASCPARRIVVAYDHAATNFDGPHHDAALELAKQLGWSGEWHFAGKADNSGNVYVCVDNRSLAFSVL